MNDSVDADFSDVDLYELTMLEEQAGLTSEAATLNLHHRLELLQKSSDTDVMSIVRPRAQRRASVGGKWTEEEDNLLKNIVAAHGAKGWKKVASLLGETRTDVQCLHRWNKVLKPGLHKGAWRREEDSIVRSMVLKSGVGKVKWSSIASQLPGRIGKQCRERWFNHLDPAIKKSDWSNAEETILYEAQRHFGNRWCEISKMLPGRTENAVKNRWNSCTMKKWLKDRGLEPGTGLSHHIATKEGMMAALVAFKAALSVAGVRLEHADDTSTALLGLLSGSSCSNEPLVPVGCESSHSAKYSMQQNLSDGTISDCSSDQGRLSTEASERGGGEENDKYSSLNTLRQAPQRKRKRMTTGVGDVECDSDCVVLADSQQLLPSTSQPTHSQLPPHLRPKPLIIASSSSAAAAAAATVRQPRRDGLPECDDHDESASALVEILNQLKQQQTPSSSSSAEQQRTQPTNDGYTAIHAICEVVGQNSASAKKHLQNLADMRSQVSMESPPMDSHKNETQCAVHPQSQSAVKHGSVLAGHSSRSTQSGGSCTKSVQIKSIPSEQAATGCPPPYRTIDATVALLEGIYSCPSAPSSPTSMSLFMVDKLLGSTAAGSSSRPAPTSAPVEDAPFECLQYFKHLNSASQRSVMRQLISRFQRTSCTPRNITLNTPKYFRAQQHQQEAPASVSAAAQHMMQEMLPGYFGADSWDNGQDSGGLEPLDPNCFEMSEYDRQFHSASGGAVDTTQTSVLIECGGSGSQPSNRKFSPDDEAAIEAAVEIALLLSNSSQKHAETLVRTVLTDNFSLLSATAATIRAETINNGHKK